MAYASFLVSECRRSDRKSTIEKKATERPGCLSETAMAESEASVSTMRGIGSTAEMAELAMTFFIF